MPSHDATQGLTAKRRWWFRLSAMVAVPLLVLLLAEGLLRLAGYGYPTGFFKRGDIEGQLVWTDNHDFGRRFFPPGLARRPHCFSIPLVKPPKTVRIFVLGGSAAMGDPDFKFGLPQMLDVLLRERFPDVHFEVVNGAMVAINSNVVLPIARDCARHDGDLWVIYMGNNEMVGPFGSVTVFGAQAPSLPIIRATLAMKRTRLGQFLGAALYFLRHGDHPLPKWEGMEMMANLTVRYNSRATAAVYRHFRRNLTDILKTGVRAHVPIVLCTVATNLKDCAPFASLHRRDLAEVDREEWKGAYDEGVGWQNQGEPAKAEAAYERAARIDPQFADLAFRQGQCCHLLGRNAEAAKFFRQARDEDALQFRADDRINDIIRLAAASFAGRGVSLLDAEELFAANSTNRLTGDNYFYEHVHLRPSGNFLLARAVAGNVAKALNLQSTRPWLSRAECFRLAGLTDWNRYDDLSVILDRIEHPPFTPQSNHTSQLRLISSQRSRYLPATKPAEVRREAAELAALVNKYPQDAELRWNLAGLLENAGQGEAAAEQWRTLMRLQPQSALPAFNLAKLLDQLGRPAQALSLYRQSRRIDPEYYERHYAAGL